MKAAVRTLDECRTLERSESADSNTHECRTLERSESADSNTQEFGPKRQRWALAARVQGALERVYRLDRIADVEDYLSEARAPQDREVLLLRQADDGAIEVRLCLPVMKQDASLDAVCQVIEGVSHFVYVVERARLRRETTQLELELQAEVDKWVVLAEAIEAFDAERSAVLRERLYERVAFEHDEESEIGQRYRMANEAAHRFVRRLERLYLSAAATGPRHPELREELRRFFHVGQEEKLRLGRAA